MSGQTETPSNVRGVISGFVIAEDPDKIERARVVVQKFGTDLKLKTGIALNALREARTRAVNHQALHMTSGILGLVGNMLAKPRAHSSALPTRPILSPQKMLMLCICALSFLAAVFLPERSVQTVADINDTETVSLNLATVEEADFRATPTNVQSSETLQAIPATMALPQKPVKAPAPEPILALRDEIIPHWQPVRRPIPIYHLEAPDVEASEMDYQVAARGKTARQDRMRWTPRAGSEAQRGRVTLIIERFEAYAGTERPLLADMAQRAADQHFSIERLGQPAEITTKFGAMQVADGAFSSEGASASCTVFRRIDMSGVTIAGWYCPPVNRPLDRVRLACFLNRLNLMSAGNDQGLRSFFTKADLNRLPCISSKQAGRKTTWMDHEAPMPPLKLSGKAR